MASPEKYWTPDSLCQPDSPSPALQEPLAIMLDAPIFHHFAEDDSFAIFSVFAIFRQREPMFDSAGGVRNTGHECEIPQYVCLPSDCLFLKNSQKPIYRLNM